MAIILRSACTKNSQSVFELEVDNDQWSEAEANTVDQLQEQLAQQNTNLQYDNLRADLDMIIQVNDFLVEHSDAAG